MSRALAFQKLQAAQEKLRSAQTDVDEARRQFNFQRDQDLAEHSLGLMSAAIKEVRLGLREALQLTERGLLLPPGREC
jgi:hypothetical protein